MMSSQLSNRTRAQSVRLIFLKAAIVACTAAGGQAQQDYIPYGPLTPPPAKVVHTVLPRTVELIDEAIRAEKDLPRKVELIADLGRCSENAAAAAILKRLLDDPSPDVRASAIRSLWLIKAADEASLNKLLNDASPVVRRELVRVGVAEAILSGLKDQDPALRAASLSTSVNDATDRAIAERIPQLDPPLQAIAARTLGIRKAAGSSAVVAALLGSENVVVRVAAIDALRSMGTIDASQVDAQLAHAHSAVRRAATAAAMVLADEPRAKVATRSIADADHAVRTAAAQLLATLPAPSSVPLLVPQLSEGYEPLRLASRDALATIAAANPACAAQVIPAAASLLKNADPHRRVDGSFLLGHLKSKEALTDHIAMLDDADWRVVEQAAKSLGPIGDLSAGEKLVETALRSAKLSEQLDRDMIIVQTSAGGHAILSATMLRHTPVIKATAHFYLDKNAPGDLRQASVYALGVLGQPDEVAAGVKGLLGRINDIEESTLVVAEGIKALGNAMVTSSVSQLQHISKSSPQITVDYQYTAHVALGRIQGTSEPFVQPDVEQEAETSIRAMKQ